MAWIADRESVKMTMLFTHGGLRLSKPVGMVCQAERIAFSSASLLLLRCLSTLVRCLSVLNVHFCKKSPKLAQMTFDRYLSNPDIGRTFWDGLTHSN